MSDQALTREEIESILNDDDKRAIRAIVEIYGDDGEILLNALQFLSTRIAMLGGVTHERFMVGAKCHWDACANALKRAAN